MSYSTILQPQFSDIIQSGSVNITNNVNNTSSNQISEWIIIDSDEVNVGEVYYHQSGSWNLASIDSDEESEAVGVIEQTYLTSSGSIAKIVYKGIIDFSSDILLKLSVGKAYFLNSSTGSSSNIGPIYFRNTTIEEPLISKPIFIARSTTTALIVNMRGHTNNVNTPIPRSNIVFSPDIPCPTPPPTPPPQKLFLYVFMGPCSPDNLNCDKFGNNYQVAYCTDGITSSSVAPNTFYEYTQEEADEVALSYAANHLVCVPTVTNVSLSTYSQIPFTYQVTASNIPILYSASNVPTGMTFSTGGLLSGTPTTASTTLYNITVTALNSYGSGSGIVTLTVYGDYMKLVPNTVDYIGDGSGPISYLSMSLDGAPAIPAIPNESYYFTRNISVISNFTHSYISGELDQQYTFTSIGNNTIRKSGSFNMFTFSRSASYSGGVTCYSSADILGGQMGIYNISEGSTSSFLSVSRTGSSDETISDGNSFTSQISINPITLNNFTGSYSSNLTLNITH